MESPNPQHICPATCPNRGNRIGKGYSYLFAICLTGLLAWQSVSVRTNARGEWEIQSKDIPLALIVPSLFLIAGSLGFNTDPIAEKVGNILSK